MVSAMTAAAIRSDWAGRVIDGRFTLLRWLGGSESSGVFLTELQEPRLRKAAIKIIPADAPDMETRVAGWGATKDLSYPHLNSLLHTGRFQLDAADFVYAVTEYAEEVLSEIIPERPLTPNEAKEMLAPVLDTLSYLHGKGFVHGHLKPSNIMVVDNQVKLSGDSLEVAGEVGKHFPAQTIYGAPEVATEPISPAADVWSLGFLLVEALTQHPPVWDRSANREPVVPESVPQPFAGIAQECLRSDQARRCTTREVKDRLEGAASSLSNPASKTSRAVPTKLLVTVLIGAMLVVFAVIVALQLRSHRTRPTPVAETQQPVHATAPSTQSPVSAIPTSKGLAVNGSVDKRVLPDVPQSAMMTIRGTVRVRIRVTVDPSGEVSNARFDSPGVSKYFANLALEAARNWRFKPTEVDGQPVTSVWILQFQFRRTATEVVPVEAVP